MGKSSACSINPALSFSGVLALGDGCGNMEQDFMHCFVNVDMRVPAMLAPAVEMVLIHAVRTKSHHVYHADRDIKSNMTQEMELVKNDARDQGKKTFW